MSTEKLSQAPLLYIYCGWTIILLRLIVGILDLEIFDRPASTILPPSLIRHPHVPPSLVFQLGWTFSPGVGYIFSFLIEESDPTLVLLLSIGFPPRFTVEPAPLFLAVVLELANMFSPWSTFREPRNALLF